MSQSRIDLDDVSEGLAALSRAATRRKREAFQELKPLAKADLRERGRSRTGPDGKAWAPGAPASLRKARRDRRRHRRPGTLGKLTTAWKSNIEPEQLRFVNAIDLAAIHHHGAIVGRGARNPARPFAGFSVEFSDRAAEIWADTVTGVW